MGVIQVNDASFDQEVLQSSRPVLVDFFAPWCGPCQMMVPVLEELSKEYAGKVKVVKLNTDENSKSAVKYGITGIPCLIIFKDGKEADRLIGFRSKDAFKSSLDKVLK